MTIEKKKKQEHGLSELIDFSGGFEALFLHLCGV